MSNISHIDKIKRLIYENRTQDALRNTKIALKKHGQNPEILNIAGYLYNIAGDYNKAQSCLEKALRFDPENAKIHNSLGISLQEQGYKNEAKLLFKKAIKLDPQNTDSYLNISRFYLDEKDYKLAKINIKAARRIKRESYFSALLLELYLTQFRIHITFAMITFLMLSLISKSNSSYIFILLSIIPLVLRVYIDYVVGVKRKYKSMVVIILYVAGYILFRLI